MNKKLRIIFDLDLKSKNQFGYEFRFIDVSKTNKKIDLDRLCVMLRKILDDLEMKSEEDKDSTIFNSKNLH